MAKQHALHHYLCCLARGCARCRWLVLRHPTEGEPHDRVVLDYTSPRVSITARFEQKAEMQATRLQPGPRYRIMRQRLGLHANANANACLQVLWCVLREEKGGRVNLRDGDVQVLPNRQWILCVCFLIHLCLHP